MLIFSVQWTQFENMLKENGKELNKKEAEILKSVIGEMYQNILIINFKRLEFLDSIKTLKNNEVELEDDDFDECRDNCTIYGYLSKTKNEKITENFTEDQLVKVLFDANESNSDIVSEI